MLSKSSRNIENTFLNSVVGRVVGELKKAFFMFLFCSGAYELILGYLFTCTDTVELIPGSLYIFIKIYLNIQPISVTKKHHDEEVDEFLKIVVFF
jgi:hypothetical protein